MKRLGICIAGLNGSVASTLVAGVALMRRGLACPTAMFSEGFLSSHGLAPLETFVFGGWDERGETLYESALRNRVLEPQRLQPIVKELARLRPLQAPGSVQGAIRDLRRLRRTQNLDTVVVLNLVPTGEDEASAVYAKAADEAGCPFVNFTPNDCSEEGLHRIPYCGKDGKTGQTWLKSVLAPALRARGLRVRGWYSTNLLGNEDGRVVADSVMGRAKVATKTKLLGSMLGYEPHHQV